MTKNNLFEMLKKQDKLLMEQKNEIDIYKKRADNLLKSIYLKKRYQPDNHSTDN